MPRVQRMDISHRDADEARWIAPPSLLVCERAQVHDSGTGPAAKEGRDSARSHKGCPWPFLYSYQGSTVIINAAPTRTKYEAAAEVGVATF